MDEDTLALAGERERSLQAIGDVVEHWIKWVTRGAGEPVSPDTHIILLGDNAPPVWPSVGQLKLWLEVLRGGSTK